MADRDRRHIIVPGAPAPEPFTLAAAGGATERSEFPDDRGEHGRRLIREFRRAASSPEDGEDGAYITFASFPGLDLAVESLEPQNAGDQPELVAVRELPTDDGIVQQATVYVPDGKKQYFFDRLTRYLESLDNDDIRHAALVEGIGSIRRATIRELWTDPDEWFPRDTEQHWWEVWLRRRDGRETDRLSAFSQRSGLRTSGRYLGFGDRTVVLLQATPQQLAETFEALDDIAELRRPHEIASFLTELPAAEQIEWTDDLRRRIEAAGASAPVVCVLDTGIQDGHPLLEHSLDPADVHGLDGPGSAVPRGPHATEMAGLALYGDLHGAIVSQETVRLTHRLESVRILPNDNGDRELYGVVTARGVDRPEIQAVQRSRVFLLAITAPRENTPGVEGREAGRPTSWSATIDALSSGRAVDDSRPGFTYLDRTASARPRLFVVSAGNIRDVSATDDHLDRSDLEPIEDPAQAWNAITVGAYSPTDDMAGAPRDFEGYVPLAPRGELAPVSRTSVLVDRTKWPFKPEVVADGGNLARSPDGTTADTPPNLAVLTSRYRLPGEGFFTTARDTSAATAQIAAIAGAITATYPQLRPETVRALIVHSAEWTEAMKRRVELEPSKTGVAMLLRRYGMGVPDLDRALRSASDALTLVSEASIRPYERDGNTSVGRVREMNLHELPWPTAQLHALGATTVRLRVTLSYFVEPNPSSRGWTGRYIYPSHGLRFATRRSEENVDSFRARINTRARAGGQAPLQLGTEKGWTLGRNQQQAPGSLHTDIWTGSAVDLASKGAIVVYPVAGWWKNRRHEDRSNDGVAYSLVVSIDSPEVEVDLWTAVDQQVRSAVPIEL